MATFTGTAGNDIVPTLLEALAALGNDSIYGLAGDDLLVGYTGDDLFNGGSGADVIVGGVLEIGVLGAEITLFGNNTVSYADSASRVVVDLSTTSDLLDVPILGLELDLIDAVTGQGGDAEGDLLVGISNLRGSAHNDHFTGNDEVNVLEGNDGKDLLSGKGGNDTLFGGNGRDVLDGGTGADDMIGGRDTDFYYVDSLGDQVTEWAAQGHDLVYSSISLDLSVLSQHVERLYLTGTDTLTAIGNARDNILRGNTDANVVTGSNGNDVLYGNLGNDTLYGGADRDILIGGIGDDELFGGADLDTFKFTNASGSDLIRDFNLNGEKIDFSEVGAITSWTDLQEDHLSSNGSGEAVITANGIEITVAGVAAADLTQDNFLFAI